jgi:hypothetical protein
VRSGAEAEDAAVLKALELQKSAGIDMVHVPFKGSGQSIISQLAGEIGPWRQLANASGGRGPGLAMPWYFSRSSDHAWL